MRIARPVTTRAMSTGHLTIDLDAVAANWASLDAKSAGETAAVLKADGYGLGTIPVGKALAQAGARRFFVAVAEEGVSLRTALGPEVEINVFSGHMLGDTELIRGANLVPMINSPEQLNRHLESLPSHPFGVQLDSGMNRLGMEWSEWASVAEKALSHRPTLVMSHLACADDPDHPMNAYQLDVFRQMTDGISTPRSLAATGGILLGKKYHFDVTRPGVGIYGGLPFRDAKPVVRLDLPVIQTRDLIEGEVVGYGNSWQAKRPSKIATISVGYADGLIRAMSGKVKFFAENRTCLAVGRVSMDLITVDVTDLPEPPSFLTLLGSHQGVDDVADAAGTIGYEILTSLGGRYSRQYL